MSVIVVGIIETHPCSSSSSVGGDSGVLVQDLDVLSTTAPTVVSILLQFVALGLFVALPLLVLFALMLGCCFRVLGQVVELAAASVHVGSVCRGYGSGIQDLKS
jgi:hypothetical protein